jgi:hypothetical protein
MRAAMLLFVAAFGTQLHVAAVPLALVAGVIVLSRARRLHVHGLAWAALAGALPLLPMLAALAEPVPAVATPTVVLDPREHRLGDLLLLVPRVLTGLTPAALPLPVRAWLPGEALLGGATLAAALVLLLRPPLRVDARAVRIVAAFFWVGVVAVLLLPADAWYYYLDTTLVPGAVLLGIAGASLSSRAARGPAAALLVVVLARTALLAWWIRLAAVAGYVPANLDWLHLGGARPAAPDARARLLTVATKAAAADALVRDAGIPLDRLWRDVHGSAFSDLDNDNGYFFARAARAAEADGPRSAVVDSGRSALVSYPGELPADWLGAFAPAERVGPVEIRTYVPTLSPPAAGLRGCTGTLPVPPLPEPLAYGAGEPPWPTWPCATPTVFARALPAPDGTVVRVLARVDGAARVASVVADPPSAALAPDAPGAGIGVEVAASGAEIAVRLDVDGPARLDLYELHGLR